MTAEQRFWSYVHKTNTCWIWIGALRSEYGQFRINNRGISAHRFSWELHFGEIPKGMFVLHECDNPCCVNPNHLFLGTNRDNVDDRCDKQRGSRGEKHGRSFLIEKHVIEIYQSKERNYLLAKDYEVDRRTISDIKSGRRWGWLTKDLKLGACRKAGVC